jgi:hypothetical protein
MLNNNMEFFNCIKRDKSSSIYKELKKAFNMITPLVNYETNTEYIRFLGYIREFDDAESFEIAIELLKYHNQNLMTTAEETQSSDIVYYWDVNYSVFTRVLSPHIYSINGQVFDINHPELHKMNFMIEYEPVEKFYNYFKGLWTSGKIVLKSQVKE